MSKSLTAFKNLTPYDETHKNFKKLLTENVQSRQKVNNTGVNERLYHGVKCIETHNQTEKPKNTSSAKIN